MEVGQAVLALNLVDPELDLAESVVLILLEIGQGDLEDSSLQSVVGVLETGGSVDEGLADTVVSVVRFTVLRSWFSTLSARARGFGGRSLLSNVEGGRSLKIRIAVSQSLAKQRIEHHNAAYLEGVPVLAGEGVLGLLLEALLTLGKSLVPAGGIELAIESVVKIVYHRIPRATYLPTAILTNAGR